MFCVTAGTQKPFFHPPLSLFFDRFFSYSLIIFGTLILPPRSLRAQIPPVKVPTPQSSQAHHILPPEFFPLRASTPRRNPHCSRRFLRGSLPFGVPDREPKGSQKYTEISDFCFCVSFCLCVCVSCGVLFFFFCFGYLREKRMRFEG